MGDVSIDWKPDLVKLELDPIVVNDFGWESWEANFKEFHPETGQNIFGETSAEQSSAIPGRFELHLVYGLPSTPQLVTSTSQGQANVLVKIKEEMIEDSIPSSEYLTDRILYPSPETLPPGSCEFSEGRISIKTEDNSAGENVVIKMEPTELDFMNTDQETESYPLSAYELYSDYDSVIDYPCTSFIPANNTMNSTTNDATQSFMNSLPNVWPTTSKQCSASSRIDAYTVLPGTQTFNKKCFFCNFAEFTRKGLLNKFPIHSSEEVFMCDECCVRLRRTDNRLSSFQSDKKTFTCDQCSISFPGKSCLRRHLLLHSDKKPFCCDQCDARFKRESNLRQHLLRHSDEKAFFCDQCSALFKRKYHLKRHLLIHSKNKSFSCDYCSSRFKQKCHLKQHLLSHCKKKSYSCGHCSARFKGKYYFQKHVIACTQVPES